MLSVVAAVASIAVAIYTAVLASATRELAEETADSIKAANEANRWADRHHQEALCPSLYVDGDFTLTVSGHEATAALHGTIKNVGTGPALNVNVIVKPDLYVEKPFFVGPIAAAAEIELRGVSWIVSPPMSVPNPTWPFEVTTEYNSAFGTPGRTVQKSNSGFRGNLVVISATAPAYVERELPGALKVRRKFRRKFMWLKF